MDNIEKLRLMFSRGQVQSTDGDVLSFGGELDKFNYGMESLEKEIGYKLPEEIRKFLKSFGGTELFVSDTPGTRVHAIPNITEYNKEQEKTTDPFFPKFVIIAEDWMDDMMCLYNDGEKIHFGNLHHEAWGEPDCWATEAFIAAKFNDWLAQFVESYGSETIPNDDIQYEI
jgi:hypothetical protein